jgi:hypothetical protein
MGLAPSEQRALARIEDSLCRSDPGLAARLATFAAAPAPRRKRLASWRPIMPFIPVTVAVTAACLVIAAALLLSHPGRRLPCGPGMPSSVSTLGVCPPAGSGVARHIRAGPPVTLRPAANSGRGTISAGLPVTHMAAGGLGQGRQFLPAPARPCHGRAGPPWCASPAACRGTAYVGPRYSSL